jgi:hypothetical protein
MGENSTNLVTLSGMYVEQLQSQPDGWLLNIQNQLIRIIHKKEDEAAFFTELL